MEAVIFVGIQATGKSTFYAQHFAKTHLRISLDLLKTRYREDSVLDACIAARKPFVVDNTNVLIREREKYITRAKEAGYRVTGYYFHTSLKEALQRNQQRSGKAVIPVRGVIAKYRALQLPQYEEGFDQLYLLSIRPDGTFAIQDWIDPEPLVHIRP